MLRVLAADRRSGHRKIQGPRVSGALF